MDESARTSDDRIVVLAKLNQIVKLRVACYRFFAVRAGVLRRLLPPSQARSEAVRRLVAGLGTASPDQRAPALGEASKAVNFR